MISARSAASAFYVVLSVRQLIVDADQLFFGHEIDLDPSSLPLTDDADAGAEEEFEAILRGARVDVDRRSASAASRAGVPARRFS